MLCLVRTRSLAKIFSGPCDGQAQKRPIRASTFTDSGAAAELGTLKISMTVYMKCGHWKGMQARGKAPTADAKHTENANSVIRCFPGWKSRGHYLLHTLKLAIPIKSHGRHNSNMTYRPISAKNKQTQAIIHANRVLAYTRPELRM